MIAVAGIAGRLRKGRSLQVLKHPEVRIQVVPFDLVRRSGDSPLKSLWKGRAAGFGQALCGDAQPRRESGRPELSAIHVLPRRFDSLLS